jgi:hypothetical protein
VNSKLRAIALELQLICSIGLSVARGNAQMPVPRVYLQALAGHEDVLNRLSAELHSDGFEPELLAADEPSPCAPERTKNAGDGAGFSAAFAGLIIRLDPSTDELVAELCHVPAPPPPEQAVVRAPAGEPARFALAVVEALNGLTTPVRVVPAPRSSRAPVVVERSSAASPACFASAALVLQPTGVGPLPGASIGLDAPIHRHVALEIEVFAPFRASAAPGLHRDLSISTGWARLGARVSSALPELNFGVSLHTGVALVWATARSRDPLLVGTLDLMTAALVAGGVWLEYPRQSPVYLRAAAHAARLLPSARLELGGGASESFGDLLLEFGLGAGVRWSSE